LKKRIGPTGLVGLLLFVLLICIRLFDPLPVQTLRVSLFDYYQVLKPREFTPQPVAIVDIDEASLRAIGQWPWPRSRIADLIDAMARGGSVAIGFDIVFSEPDRLSPGQIAKDNVALDSRVKQQLEKLPDNETLMANAMRRHPVVLGQSSVRNKRDTNKDEPDIRTVGFAQIGEDPKPYLRNSTFYDLVQNVKRLEDAASGLGIFSIQPESDGVVRRVPIVSLVRDKVRLALSAELLRVSTGEQSFAVKTGEAGIEGVILAGNLIETDWSGRIWPYFSAQNPERYISAARLLDGTLDDNSLSGHMILVGTSAIGLESYRPTPLGQAMPGVEIHAQIMENMLSDSFLKRPVYYAILELLMILAAGTLVLVLTRALGAIKSLATITVLVVAIFAFSWWNFSNNLLLLDATYPVFVIITLFIFTVTANYMREERQRQRIRTAFGQYLSPGLVDQLTENPEKLVLGGETRELSVLFCDVRRFTAISESYHDNPQGLTILMNELMTVLSMPILKTDGTIDKYMGDAVMAFWNAPLSDENHAFNACSAALEMIAAVEAMNALREKPIHIGIGINTGECVVGNMGSDIRFNYTAVGDTVNVASRLEGQSKPYGLPVIVGERTNQLLGDRLATLEVDLVRVKGKQQPVHIFALAGDESLAANEDFIALRALNTSMLSSYRLQDWPSALDAMDMIQRLNTKLSLPLDDYIFIYQSRIEEFRTNRPGAQWDGVYTAIEK